MVQHSRSVELGPRRWSAAFRHNSSSCPVMFHRISHTRDLIRWFIVLRRAAVGSVFADFYPQNASAFVPLFKGSSASFERSDIFISISKPSSSSSSSSPRSSSANEAFCVYEQRQYIHLLFTVNGRHIQKKTNKKETHTDTHKDNYIYRSDITQNVNNLIQKLHIYE